MARRDKNKSRKKKTVLKNGESSSEKEKTKILVHTINREEREDGWFMFGEFYIIDLINKEIKELPYVLAGGDHGLNTMVSIGSTVYVVGGLNLESGKEFATKPPNYATNNKKGILYHHGMSFIDLNSNSNSPDAGWKSAPCNRTL